MKSKRNSPFDPQVYLESVGVSRQVGEFRKKQTIFTQGDAADTVMYVQKGSVKFTVVNESGKEAVVAIFGSGISSEKEPSPATRFGWVQRRLLRRQLSS
jgi:hypothetical protein